MRIRVIVSTLASIALLFWVLSIYEARLKIGQGIGEFGITSVLPANFFVSVSLLSVSFLLSLKMRNGSETAAFCQTIILIFVLNFTPRMVEGTARFHTTYANYQSVDYVSQKGYVNPSAQWIHNWPSFSIAYSALMQITALPDQILLSIYPTFFSLALLFPLFVFFRLVVDNEKLRWIAIWTCYIGNWVGQDYFSMQSLGFFAFVLILFVTFKLTNSRARTCSWFVTAILFFSLVVTSHMLSSLAILAVVFVFFASKYLRRTVLVTLLGAIFASWTIYGAATYLEWNLARFIAEALNFELIFQSNLTARVAGSVARIMVTQIRLIFSALVIVFAFSGFVLTWKRGKMGNIEKRILFILIGVSLLLGFSAYGGELFMRLFLFSLIPLSYFVSKGSNRKIFFCLLSLFLIIVAPPLHMVAHYGNEVMDYVPPSEIRGAEFFHKHTTLGYVIGWYRDSGYRQIYQYFSFSRAEWKNNTLSLGWIESEHLDWPRFVCISYGTREYYNFFLGKPQFIVELYKNMSESTRYNRIYSNPNFDSYTES